MPPSFLLLLFCTLPLAAQQTFICGSPPSLHAGERSCSFTGLNGDCAIVIDRLRPSSPPIINARRGGYISVQIADPSPFEKLSLDLKSATSVVPVDPFSNAFTTLLGAAKTIEVVGVIGQRIAGVPDPVNQISQDQKTLFDAIQKSIVKAKTAIALIAPATQPPPGNVCFGSPKDAQPWLDTATWIQNADQALDNALAVTYPDGTSSSDPAAATRLINALQNRIDILTPAQATADEKTKLNTYQTQLASEVASLTKLKALRGVVDAIPVKPPTLTLTIVDLQADRTGSKVTLIDKNDQNEAWQVSFVNTFSQAVTNALADPVTDPIKLAQNALQSASAQKSSLVAITADYQTAPRLEVSSGLMVPLQPYHSYASAEAAANGSVTGYVVQESLTYTVIPVAQLNFVAADWVAHRQRAAFFATIAVGYNPATSNVEFGVGPSISWKSLVFSGLADIGRDTKLTDGFTVGQSLGNSSSVKPLTSTVWVLKPAVGISVRIPLGSSSGK